MFLSEGFTFSLDSNITITLRQNVLTFAAESKEVKPQYWMYMFVGARICVTISARRM